MQPAFHAPPDTRSGDVGCFALRCESRLHGEVLDRVIEVKCHSKRCGAGAGVTVLHQFSLDTGELLRTSKFKDPAVLLGADPPAGI